MNKGLIAALGSLAIIVGLCVISYVSAFNAGNKMENKIVAVYENNENILAQYGQKIGEAAQVPNMQTEDLAKVFAAANESRYGKDGSNAGMQWIKEQNPSLDQDTYKQIQRMIEAGRNEFTTAQTKLIDVKRTYNTALGSFWKGMWLGKAGYPQINIGFPRGSQDDYKAITTGRARDAFKTGVEKAPIKLR